MRFLGLFAALALLTALPAGASAFAAEGPSILVVESPGTTAPETRRREIRPAVEHAAKQAGATIVQAKRVPASLLSGCSGPECAAKAGKAGKASHVILVDAAYVDDGFKLRLELYDVATGRQLSAEGQSCQVCTFPAFLKALRETTTLLCTRGLQGPGSAAAPAPSTPVAAEPPVEVEAAPSIPSPSPSPAIETHHRDEPKTPPSRAMSTFGWVGIGMGVVAVGLGALVISKHGDPTCTGDPDRCPLKRNTLLPGLAVGGAGVVLAGVGGYLVWKAPSSSASVAVSPSGVAISGRF